MKFKKLLLSASVLTLALVFSCFAFAKHSINHSRNQHSKQNRTVVVKCDNSRGGDFSERDNHNMDIGGNVHQGGGKGDKNILKN